VAQIPIDKLVEEVEKGLSTEAKQRMTEAQRAIDFFAFRGKQHMGEYLLDSEGQFGAGRRQYRASGLVREIVNVLTDHLYSPGPSRTWDQPAGQDFLERVYSDNHVDSLMLRCDQLSTLGDAAAIQVDVDEGVFEDKPVTLRVWGPDEFHVWEDPDCRSRAAAVVTKDKYDEQTRYRLWTDEEVRTFVTQRGGGTAGGRVATQIAAEPNTYGCLPFGFAHYDYPVQCFWEAGIGDFLEDSEIRVNDRLSRLDEAIHKHLNPVPYVTNGTPGMRLTMEAQRFVILPGARQVMGSKGVETTDGATLGYLQASIDVASAWEDLRGFILQVLEACGVPQSAVQLDYTDAPSGISIVIRSAPLLSRAKKRQGPYSIYETGLARTILRCAGNHYGRADLVQAAKAGKLSLGWPAPSVVVATADWLDTEKLKVEMGVKSVVMVAQEMYGVPREQALEIIKQVTVDQEELVAINPDLKPPTPEELAAAQQAPGQGPDQQENQP
jgi:hypothetical protein